MLEIPGAKFSRLNNQSKFTRWVREMWAPPHRYLRRQTKTLSGWRCVFGGTLYWRNTVKTVCLPLVRHERFRFGRGSVLRRNSFHILDQRPTEISSASVLLCETAVCLLQVQLIGTNVWLLQNAQRASCRWFRVLQKHLQNRHPHV